MAARTRANGNRKRLSAWPAPSTPSCWPSKGTPNQALQQTWAACSVSGTHSFPSGPAAELYVRRHEGCISSLQPSQGKRRRRESESVFESQRRRRPVLPPRRGGVAMKIHRLDHLHIYAVDPEGSTRFYTEVFGAKAIGKARSSYGGAMHFLQLGGVVLVLG